jgi:hypothetical protein
MESTRGLGRNVVASRRNARIPDEQEPALRPARASWPTVEKFLAVPDAELRSVDPVVMNLVVAKGIPALADLDIERYVRLADEWAKDLLARMRTKEKEFFRTPQKWRNDIDFFRLGLVCWYCDVVLGVAYHEDQRNVDEKAGIRYTDPTHLFLNGVMDTRRGTCGNMALLHVVLGRRVGLPVHLACVWAHFLCRFDDGVKTINIETTETGRGGFSSSPDDYILAQHKMPAKAQECGSDLRALTARETLAMFLYTRGRHFEDTERYEDAERDYLLARYLFPRHRRLYMAQTQVSVWRSTDLFEPHEKGHIVGLAEYLDGLIRAAPWAGKPPGKPIKNTQQPKESRNGLCVDAVLQEIIAGRRFI